MVTAAVTCVSKQMLGSHLNSWMIELDQLHSNTFFFTVAYVKM